MKGMIMGLDGELGEIKIKLSTFEDNE